jgi:hypothetical protein
VLTISAALVFRSAKFKRGSAVQVPEVVGNAQLQCRAHLKAILSTRLGSLVEGEQTLRWAVAVNASRRVSGGPRHPAGLFDRSVELLFQRAALPAAPSAQQPIELHSLPVSRGVAPRGFSVGKPLRVMILLVLQRGTSTPIRAMKSMY